ncbi:MAG TPA: hypothetical protein VK528_01590 [Flavobacterium sp.]|nr:hypothetical protein [Flavobacterium sp.]
MKKIILSVFVCAVLLACKKETPLEAGPAIVAEKPAIEECYKGILKEDTIAMTLVIKENLVTDGQLHYHFFEKDKNDGTLKGEIKGDTLFADYTFMSEGKQSIREVAFLKQGDSYLEGYGESVEKDGKMMFKDTKKLKFDSKTILSKAECHK